LANIDEIKQSRGGDLLVAAKANVQIDTEIGQKDHFCMDAPSYSEYSNCHALSCFWRSGKSLPEPLIEPAGNALLTVPEMSVFHENTKG